MNSRSGRGHLVWLAVLSATGFFATDACACDTPVYRYAMYRWTPMTYEAYFFHRGQVAKTDKELHRSLAEVGKGGGAANVSVVPVDLDRKDALDVLPEGVKKLWQAESSKPLPRYLIVAPWGAEVFAGQLDAAAMGQALQSPLRTEIGKLFDQGHGVVLLILGGNSAEENARMEGAAKAVAAKAAAGELFAEPTPDPEPVKPASPPEKSPPGGPPAKSPPEKSPAEKPPAERSQGENAPPDPRRAPLRIGVVKLDRSNAAEAWLMKVLAAMSPGSQKDPKAKAAGEPMLFAIYGRGRAMPPGVGKQVTAESLGDLLRFLADRCSCTIKDQNPGLDLLMQWDWEATSEKLAASDPAAAPPPLYSEVSADGAGMAASKADSGPASSPPDAAKGDAAGRIANPSNIPATSHRALSPAHKMKSPPQRAETERPKAPDAPSPTVSSAPDPKTAAIAQSPSPPPAGVSETEESAQAGFAARQRWQLGLGLVGVAVVVIAVGLVLMRRQ